MHIMEGFLPFTHAVGWTIAAVPFVAGGLLAIKKRIRDKPEQRMLLGVAAAFAFVLSALKLPSVTGSCSHPTGTGLGALLFGPVAMAPIGAVVLLFQALLPPAFSAWRAALRPRLPSASFSRPVWPTYRPT